MDCNSITILIHSHQETTSLQEVHLAPARWEAVQWDRLKSRINVNIATRRSLPLSSLANIH